MKRTITNSRFLRFFFIPFLTLLLNNQSYATTWYVSNGNDSGPGSLRAVSGPSGAAAGDSIYFSAVNITLASSLTFSNSGVILNGFNAPGAGPGVSKVIISGSIGTAFIITGSDITIKGFTFQGFSTNCINLSSAPNFKITGCFFGTDSGGSTAVATPGIGIYATGTSYGTIGGPTPGSQNVFYTSGSAGTCVQVYNVTATSATNLIKIIGNKMGTNYAGTASFNLAGNCGVKLSYAKYVTIGGLLAGEGNQIDGCVSASGIWSDPQTGGNYFITIQGNKIGTVAGCYNGILMGGSGPHNSFVIEANKINNSGNVAIDMSGATTVSQIKITKNTFSNNANGGINNAYTPPTISYATPAKIGGTAAGAGATVEIFDWDGLTANPQGTNFMASVTADASGNWFYYGSFTVGQKLVVNTTPSSGNPSTTKFTASYPVAACTSSVNAGPDQTVCATTTTVNLSATPTNVTSPNWTILAGGGTLSNPNTYTPVYNLSVGEQNTSTALTVKLVISVSTATCAATITDTVAITIAPKPVVNAGANQSICANAAGGLTLTGASVTNAGGGVWSNGAGVFTPNANALNAAYTPTAAERSAGNVTLILTSTGNGSCTAVTATKVINITPAPTVSAGTNQTVCATTSSLALSGSVTVATGGQWTTSGSGSFTSPTSLNTTYNFTAAEKTAGSVTLTLTSTGNGSCSPVMSQKVISFNAPPVANAGPDKSVCVPTSTVSLTGTANNAVAVQWTSTGGGIISNSTTLNATYSPTAAESNATAPLTINFTLMASGTGGCAAVTDVMTLTLAPTSANAGSDLTMCANATNISLGGSTGGATSSVWSTSGSGTFANPSLTTTVYTPSTADRTAGSVTLTLTATGCGTASDAMVLTITPCLIPAKLTFDTPNLFKPNETVPFKHTYTTNSGGAITYAIQKASNGAVSSCATVDANGYVKLTCVDTLKVFAYQASKGAYAADTASYTLYVGKAVTKIVLESRGGVVSDTFRLKVHTNYDQPLTYSIVGGDLTAISITSDGLITGLNVGTTYVSAHAAGDANYQSADAANVEVTIYPNLTPPVAVNDTLHMLIGETQTIDIASNDYGTTASINLSPMKLDIDAENPGIQNKYFRPSIGIFTVDSTGILTFSAFQAFIGTDSIQYTVTDANGITSKKASLVFMVASPVAEIAMKANEIITANGDNVNDALVVGYTDLTQSNDLLVVDAAGNKLYYEKNYQNNWSATDSSGNNLGNGVYYYIFREFDSAGTVRRQLKGNFTVIR